MHHTDDIRAGYEVRDTKNNVIGKVERFAKDVLHVGGREIPSNAINRVEGNRVYLSEAADRYTTAGGRAGMMAQETEGTMRVPVVEERLDVEKRAGQRGEVEVQKRTVEEQVSVPVELRREEVHVERREVADRPIEAGEANRIFEEGTIRVPVRGEEAIVTKEAVVTGEVVITKEQTVERQEVSDTVRRQEVEVDESYDRLRGTFQEDFQRANTGGTRRWEEAEPNYRFGYAAARNKQYANRKFEEVEPDLRRSWESSYKGTDGWERLRREIREGWERARSV